MLRRGAGGRVPYPTAEQINEAFERDLAIEACSGQRFELGIVMNIAFRNGDISTVYLDEIVALNFVGALIALFPSIQSAPASPAKVDDEGRVRAGYMSG